MNRFVTKVGLVEHPQRKEEALEFIARTYRETFGTSPPPPQVLFAAWVDSQVVGTMGLDFSDEKGNVPLAYLYRFRREQAPFPVDGPRTIQYGRWIATVRNISHILVYAATVYAIEQGKRYGWCAQKNGAAEVLIRMGIALRPVSGAVIIPSCVPKADTEYYCAGTAPKLYMVELRQVAYALEESVNRFTAKHTLVIEHDNRKIAV